MKEFANEYKEINENALLEKWSSLAPQFRSILLVNYKIKNFETGWSDEIEDMLVLLKLLPSKQVGKHVISSEHTFNGAVDKFLKFMQVPMEELIFFEYL